MIHPSCQDERILGANHRAMVQMRGQHLVQRPAGRPIAVVFLPSLVIRPHASSMVIGEYNASTIRFLALKDSVSMPLVSMKCTLPSARNSRKSQT